MDTAYSKEEAGDAILAPGETALEAWTPEDFDHFTDLGLLRPERDLDAGLA